MSRISEILICIMCLLFGLMLLNFFRDSTAERNYQMEVNESRVGRNQ